MDINFYKNYYRDLKVLNVDNDFYYNHYEDNGKKEGRLVCENDFYNKFPTFDLDFYRKFYPELGILFNEDKYLIIKHYEDNGLQEGRLGCENDFYIKFPTFDLDFYRKFYPELGILFNHDKYLIMRHYEDNGLQEGRLVCENDFLKKYPAFDLDFYRHYYKDLSIFNGNKYLLMSHFYHYGLKEERVYCEKKFLQRYPSFDIDFYNSFYYNELQILNNERNLLMSHYYNYGRNEEKKICASDFNLSLNNISSNNGKIIIYILCHNEEKLNNAFVIYEKYSWAKPILMKYKNYLFENSFWFQLSELEKEWENCRMIGTLSHSSFKKKNLDLINTIITNNLFEPNVYYHFMDSIVQIPNANTVKHPYFDIIWKNSLIDLKLLDVTESNCNYWMCKPIIMKYFINWFINNSFKKLIKYPYIFEDALYTGEDYNNSVSKEKLIKIWGKPFYPHYIFIVERLNKSFFVSYHKIVFLISHEYSFTGAVNALLNIQKFYEKNNIKTVLLYLPDIINKNLNILDYIKSTSKNYNCSPVVICNTLVCYNIVKKLSFTNIPTYWYIHEWYDKNNNYFPFIDNELHLFNSNVCKIFICDKMYENYKKLIPILNNELIINNGYNPDLLEEKINKNPEISINIDTNDDFIISIIGSIEKRKNQQRFLDDVFYRLVEKYQNVKLLLVGKIFENIIINDKYKKNIILTGNVTNAIPYIKMSDIIISYSINEVFPLNIIEAFYCSKPVIASNVGGISEMIENNVNGYLFEVNDYDKCYEYINILIENEELRKLIGINARDKFDKNYHENIAFQKFLLLLGYSNKISYTSSITDCNCINENINAEKTLTILACHSDNSIKINTLLNNLKYFIEISDDIVIVNSKECDTLNLEDKILYEYSNANIMCNDNLTDQMCNSYREMYINEFMNYSNDDLRIHWIEYGKKEKIKISKDKIVNIIFKYYDNDIHLCHGKWLNYLKTINIEDNLYDNYILANDSFLVTKSLKKFSDLKVFNTELYGIVASSQIKYHYPDFLRGYNKFGLKKIMHYYENNKFLIKNYDDAVEINEINSTYIFETKNVLYESDANYEHNIHFHEEKIKDYLLNRDYPIIKLRYFNLNKEIPDFLSKYLEMNNINFF
jgi:glycosyltransferase involved in cell wall biosynthesis